MHDVVESSPGPSRRGLWWGVAVTVAVAALVAGALRGGPRETGPAPAPTLAGTATPPAQPASPTPLPRLSAPAGTAAFGVVVVAERSIVLGGRTVYTAGREQRIASFARTRNGWAAVVAEEPVRSATPRRMVVRTGTRVRTIAVDDGTDVLPGATADTFWTTRIGGATQRRTAGGDVEATERVPEPWRVVGATVGGLLLHDETSLRVAVWRRGRAEVLARDALSPAVTPTHAAWTTYLCSAEGCEVTVRDMRAGTAWTARVPGHQAGSIAVNARGDAVVTRQSFSGGWVVRVTRRGAASVEAASSPELTQGQSFLDADWIDDDSVAVFDVGDDVRAFAYDVRTRRLTAAGTYDVRNVSVVLAEPA